MFIKEKIADSMNARGCADIRTQQQYTNKEYVSLSTISLEAMMMSCARDAKENRYVILKDIPGLSYMQT